MKPAPLTSRFRFATDARAMAGPCAAAFAADVVGPRWRDLTVANVLPGRNGFALQYRVPLAEGTVGHIGGILPSDPHARPEWAEGPGTAWLPEPGIALALPAADPRLRRAHRVLTTEWHRDLARTLGWSGVPDGPPSILTYRLGKRCVLRCGTGPEAAVVKLVRRGHLGRLVAAHRRMTDGTCPAVLHVDAKAGALVMEEIVGTTLHEAAGPAARDGHAAAGSLLRSFHSPPEGDADLRTPADELAQLRSWSATAGAVFPELAAGWSERLALLAESPPTAEVSRVRLHRDFYDKQIVLSGTGPVLLDLDTAAAGDPALDVGNHLAHVRLRARQDPVGSGDAAERAASFLSGYGPAPRVHERAGWWCAASLLRLSVIYILRPRWRALTLELLEESDSCLHQWQGTS